MLSIQSSCSTTVLHLSGSCDLSQDSCVKFSEQFSSQSGSEVAEDRRVWEPDWEVSEVHVQQSEVHVQQPNRGQR